MPLRSIPVRNMINGISQQVPALRLASQAQEQINCYSSVVEGLKKRPPMHYLAKVFDGSIGDVFSHTINRDAAERYNVLIDGTGDVRIFTLPDGDARTVNYPDGNAYLQTGGNPERLRAVTVADFTFICNTAIATRMAGTTTPDRGAEAIVWVRSGNYSSDYTIKINGVVAATKTTLDSSTVDNEPDIKTNKIAEDLEAELNTNLPSGWDFTREGSVIWIKRTTGADFDIEVEDSQNGTSLKLAKASTQRFNDLPTTAPDGMVVEIIGDQTSTFDNYFVKFVAETDGAFGHGHWEETVKSGIPYQLDATTMPHALVREADGTFTFKELTWGERAAGDEESVPQPSFIGRALNDVFFHKGRLGFLADENVILSRAGEQFFHFFKETALALLDSDPIDVAGTADEVAILRHAVPFDGKLLAFADQVQFELESGNSLLTPKTASLPIVGAFEASLLAKPIPAGSVVYFTVNKGSFSGLMEYYVKDNIGTKDATEVSAHAPQYMPSTIKKLTVTDNEGLLVALSDDDPSSLYTYKYYWSGTEKLQSAWSRWEVDSSAKIVSADFIDTDLYMTVQYADALYLVQVLMDHLLVDPHSEYLTHLDRKVSEESITATYDQASDTTLLTLPYQTLADTRAVTRAVEDGSQIEGIYLDIVSKAGNAMTLTGDHRGTAFWVGEDYEASYEFSIQYLRQPTGTGSLVAVETGRTQLVYGIINMVRSGYFRVEVTPMFRDTVAHVFEARIFGSGNNKLDDSSLITGQFRFPVGGRNLQTRIKIVNDTFKPMVLQSAEFMARYTRRGQS